MKQKPVHKTISTVANARGPVSEDYIISNTNIDYSNSNHTTERQRKKISKLVSAGVLKSIDTETGKKEYVLDTTPQTRDNDQSTVKTVRDGSVRITHDEYGQLTIQPTDGTNGSYQLTTWWDDGDSGGNSVADAHLHLPETRLLNTSNPQIESNIGATPMVIADGLIETAPNVICELIDPAPTSNQLIGGTAHITVMHNNDKNGFDVTVTREHDLLTDTLQSKITLPKIEPVNNTEKFYDIINESRTFNRLSDQTEKTNTTQSKEDKITRIVDMLCCDNCDFDDEVIAEYYNTSLDHETMRDVRNREELTRLIKRTINETGNLDPIERIDCTHCQNMIYGEGNETTRLQKLTSSLT